MTAAFDEIQSELIVENMRSCLDSGRKNGRKGGRPPRMTQDKIRTVEAMLKDTTNYPFVSDIIKQLDIGRTTFYRPLIPERLFELRER